MPMVVYWTSPTSVGHELSNYLTVFLQVDPWMF